MSGHLYLLREREFINNDMNIVKAGRTQNIINRFKQYPKGSELLFIWKCDDTVEAEKCMLDLLRKCFKQRIDIGREYFEAPIEDIVETISNFLCARMRHMLFQKASVKHEVPALPEISTYTPCGDEKYIPPKHVFDIHIVAEWLDKTLNITTQVNNTIKLTDLCIFYQATHPGMDANCLSLFKTLCTDRLSRLSGVSVKTIDGITNTCTTRKDARYIVHGVRWATSITHENNVVFQWIDQHIEVTGKHSNVVLIQDIYSLFKNTILHHSIAEFRAMCKAYLSTYKGVVFKDTDTLPRTSSPTNKRKPVRHTIRGVTLYNLF